MSRIAVIGAGNVGTALGSRLAEVGHEVVFGVRDPSGRDLPGEATGISESLERADVVLLAVPWAAMADVVGSVGDAGGAVIVDATNPFGPAAPASGSGAEQVAAWTGSRRVVKAFNTTGFNVMADPGFGSERPVMPLAGDDADAKRVVSELAAAIGFDPVDAGPLANARHLESMAALWVHLARSGEGREIAFALLRR